MSEGSSLSLCMIVRDEQSTLARCLESVAGVATELIVVDTGSKDRTIEIAREFGARVFEHTWTGDFSQARNVSLAHATGEWIVFLDADEQLAPGMGSAVGSSIAATRAAGLQVTVRSHNPPGETTLYEDVAITRLFRNRTEHRFEGAIHEQIGPSIVRAGGHIEPAPGILVLHDGYATSTAQGQDRARRNLGALELALESQPDDAYLRFHLGATYQAAGEPARAEAELLRAIEIDRGELSRALTATTLYKLAQLALARGDDQAAAARAREALHLDDHNAVALQVLGVALAQQGDAHGARRAFAALIEEPRVTAEVRTLAEQLIRAFGG